MILSTCGEHDSRYVSVGNKTAMVNFDFYRYPPNPASDFPTKASGKTKIFLTFVQSPLKISRPEIPLLMIIQHKICFDPLHFQQILQFKITFFKTMLLFALKVCGRGGGGAQSFKKPFVYQFSHIQKFQAGKRIKDKNNNSTFFGWERETAFLRQIKCANKC